MLIKEHCYFLMISITLQDFFNFILKGIIKMSECPVCGAEIVLEKGTVKGELIECNDCGTELEVISVNPVIVSEAPQEEEDWGE